MLLAPPAGWQVLQPVGACQHACPRGDGCLVQMIARVVGRVRRAQCGIVKGHVAALLQRIEGAMHAFVSAPSQRELVGLYQALAQLRLQLARLLKGVRRF
jgi:uncharacterized protein YceH (UPF0502 family)